MQMIRCLYNILPIPLQNLMCSIKGLQLQRRRFGDGFFRELRKLQAGQIDPEKELKGFLYAIRNVPAYKNIYTENDANPALQDFPIINKAVVNAGYDKFINKDYRGPVHIVRTSGTTGRSIAIPNSADFINRQWATWWRFREALGIKFGTWCGWFAGTHMIVPINHKRPPFWRINYPGRQVMFSPYHLNEDNVSIYLDEIKRRELVWIHGFASNVRFLCKLAIQKKLKPIECVRFITTGAENLLPGYVDEIMKVFPNAIVRNHYGQTEGIANFSQTKEGDWKIDDDFAYTEFIPVDPTDPSRCRIVGTSFSNLAFPLVRYDIGDIAIVEWNDGKAKVLRIEGRENEYFVMKDGTKISTMRVYDIFKDAHNVVEAQIKILGDDHVELVIVKGPEFSNADEAEILRLAKFYLGNGIRIGVSYVDKIPRTASGKFKSLIKV